MNLNAITSSKTQVNTIFNMAITLFALNSKQKNRQYQVYWVIEENDAANDSVLVKYYNEKDEIIFQELMEVKNGVIDDETMLRLNQTKEKITRFLA